MGQKHHTEEHIIGMLRAAEVVASKGGTIDTFCRDQAFTKSCFGSDGRQSDPEGGSPGKLLGPARRHEGVRGRMNS